MDRYDDSRNAEGYKDPTAHAAIKAADKRDKAYYVFKTMISVARLGGFFVNSTLVIEDAEGTKYQSDAILKMRKRKED